MLSFIVLFFLCMSNNFFPSLICFIADADAVDTGSERFESNSIETVDTIADDFPSDISAKGQEKIQQNFDTNFPNKQMDDPFSQHGSINIRGLNIRYSKTECIVIHVVNLL